MTAGDMFTVAFYAVLGAVVIGFSLRSWRKVVRSRRAETPEELRERLSRDYEQRAKGGRTKPWTAGGDAGRDRGGGAGGCGGGCGGSD